VFSSFSLDGSANGLSCSKNENGVTGRPRACLYIAYFPV